MDKSKTTKTDGTFTLSCAILLSLPVLFFGILSFIAIPEFSEINKKANEAVERVNQIAALCEGKDTENVVIVNKKEITCREFSKRLRRSKTQAGDKLS